MVNNYDQLGTLYLGRRFDSSTQTATSEPILYDSRDLLTHALIVGMTGSGKTGLAVSLLEEAAIDNVPAIIIDPKGDMGNLLLQFPDMRAADILPWLDETEAARNNQTLEQRAQAQAELWRNGLHQWAQDGERIRKLQNSAEFSIYTPGSSRGRPLSLLSGLSAPVAAEAGDPEALSDRAAAGASAVLALAGIETEPGRSREHILISTVLEQAWREGQPVSLQDLIHQTQSPTFKHVGVLDLESFYPKTERFQLARGLNNLLASSSFSSWRQGEPLEIGSLLYTADGRPRISVVSISHLNDSERMFVVTLLLNELLGWTRRQSGTSSLRAIIYMDEIYGYFPPVANPPSKKPLLTLLKQARAFGMSVILATQNPADLDYKGLSNAGTWFIGRLQTQRDKERLLDGLETVASSSDRHWNRRHLDDLISSLGKRVFLMNNVHETEPVLLQTRWALSYLKGPLTWEETCRLAMRSDESHAPAPALPFPPDRHDAPSGDSKPLLPPGVQQLFAKDAAAPDAVYGPLLLASVDTHYTDSKARADVHESTVILFPFDGDAGQPNWDACVTGERALHDFATVAPVSGRYQPVPANAANPREYGRWAKEIAHWVVTRHQLHLFRAPALKMYSSAGETEGEFRIRVEREVRERRDAAIAKLQTRHAGKLATARERLRRAEQTLEKEAADVRSEALTGMVSAGAGVFGALFGRRRLSTAAQGAVRSVQRASKQGADVQRAEENLQAAAVALQELQEQTAAELEQVRKTFADTALIEVYSVRAKKTGIRVPVIALAWLPVAAG